MRKFVIAVLVALFVLGNVGVALADGFPPMSKVHHVHTLNLAWDGNS